MFLKRLFYASASILMLALAYHLGASTATAQAPSNPVVAAYSNYVVTANGDVYSYPGPSPAVAWSHVANVFSGATPAAMESFGALKARYR
jgi:hypothetical protein